MKKIISLVLSVLSVSLFLAAGCAPNQQACDAKLEVDPPNNTVTAGGCITITAKGPDGACATWEWTGPACMLTIDRNTATIKPLEKDVCEAVTYSITASFPNPVVSGYGILGCFGAGAAVGVSPGTVDATKDITILPKKSDGGNHNGGDNGGNNGGNGSGGGTTTQPSCKPAVQLSPWPTQGCGPLTVNFVVNSSNLDVGMEIKSYHFDFGDGSKLDTDAKNPGCNHTYLCKGCYKATVTAWLDDDGQKTLCAEIDITVTDP